MQREREDRRKRLSRNLGEQELAHREETARRIRAARELRRISQTELNALMADDGLGKDTAGRLERCALPLHPAYRRSLEEHLRLPAHWFTSEDIDSVVGLHPTLAPHDDDAPTIEELLDELKAATRIAESLLGRLGEHVSKRALQSRRATDLRAVADSQ